MILWIVTQTYEVDENDGYPEVSELQSFVGAFTRQEEAAHAAIEAHIDTNEPSLKTTITKTNVSLEESRRYLRISYL